jgi:hypothetical protein
MGYDPSVLHVLTRELQSLPQGAGILELGAQDLNPGLSETDVLSCALAAHPNDSKAARAAANEYDPARSLPVSSLFRRSSFRYRCIDLMEGPLTLKVDLNTYRVPDEDRGSFQLITNFGTSEHVTDQINTFRVIHDFAAADALFIHSVPCTGYFNHGLFSYNPVFFVFLANANDYQIEGMALSPPHLPFTMPKAPGLSRPAQWDGMIIQSGMLTCRLRKRGDHQFRLFTDFDQAAMERLPLSEPWASMVRDRYQLQVDQ